MGIIKQQKPLKEQIVQFQCRSGTTFLYKIQPPLRIFFLICASSTILLLPTGATLICIALFLCMAVLNHISVKEHILNCSPVFYYGILLFVSDIVNNLIPLREPTPASFLPGTNTIHTILRLLPAMQCTTLLFQTTTPLALRTGIAEIELNIRKKLHTTQKTPLARSILLFSLFLPLVFSTWQQTERSWYAKNGTQSIRKIVILIPVLISTCMHRAWETACAVQNRDAQ
jgi:biotin transport system permease protein